MRILLTLLLIVILTGCDGVQTLQTDENAVVSYKDIPGVTAEEIAAIEALKEKYYRFSYGHLFETESFRLTDGTYAGFTIMFCDLLSEMFDKEFTAVHYYDWELLKSGIDDLSIDFSGDFTTTTERQALYYMTSPIAGRTLNIYTLKTAPDIVSEADVNGMRLGFQVGTVTAGIIQESYPELSFEVVDIAKTSVAAEMLRTGEIDGFIMEEVMDLEFERYDFLRAKRFFTLVHTPVSLTTANPELEPIISVIDKYLAAGGVNTLYQLYVEGNSEYTSYRLRQSLTDDEKNYLAELTSQGKKITIGIQHDAYPASFYNERDNEFQGIAADVLEQVSVLTGIQFEPVISSEEMPISEVIAKLRNGEISMATQIIYTDSRKNDFLWSDTPYHTTHYALISRSDYPDLAMHEVFYVNVGTIKGSAHEEMFIKWFDGHNKVSAYRTVFEAFNALEQGDIDLLMLSESLLLGQTNYGEKPGFKVNISFEKAVDSTLGYNKDEQMLRSVVDRALRYIDTDKLSKKWLNKTFDYSTKIAQMQTVYVSVFALAVVVILAVLSWLFLKNKRLGKNLMAAVEEAREASKVKSQFLANMSHEIRTPMNAIIGMSELLLSEQLTERQAHYTKDINSSSHSLLAIINDILDLSKIEAGKLELNPIDYDLKLFAESLQSMFKFVAEQKGLEFRFETEGDINRCLYGDDIRLRQVLTNICGNAVKFTADGYVKLKITVTDEMLEFVIEDTGMGIREEDITRLFSAFMQADELKNRSIKGTGLGLAISKSFVELMGGTITVKSVYGQGTAFTVRIPCVDGKADAVSRIDSEHKTFRAPTAKVLVVDDNSLNLKVASGLLSMMFSINADTADSGDMAIELVKQKDYDIVFMDHMMPEKDGIETVRQIRGFGGKYGELVIIALTANAVRGAKEMFLESGFNGFISKPIETDRLTEVLRSLLPADKIETDTAAPTAEAAAESEFLSTLRAVDGVNVDVGLSRFSGAEDMFKETLVLLYQKLMGERDKLAGFLEAEDLHNFSVLVHGVKSSLSTIGAMELSGEAFALETASKDGDLNGCREQFPHFSDGLTRLYAQLTPVAAVPEIDDKARAEGDAGYLDEQVRIALAAADDFDADTTVEVLDRLSGYDFGQQTDTVLKNARNAINDFDFDTAVDLLNSLVTS